MKRNIKTNLLMIFLILLSPVVVFAQAPDGSKITGILGNILDIFGILIPIIIGLAVIYFLWGLIKYVTASDANSAAEARNMIIMGIIVLFVMVAIWGLVAFIENFTDIDVGANAPDAPGIPGRSGGPVTDSYWDPDPDYGGDFEFGDDLNDSFNNADPTLEDPFQLGN